MKDLCQTCQLDDYVIHNLFNYYTRSNTIVTAAKEKTFKGLLLESHFIWKKSEDDANFTRVPLDEKAGKTFSLINFIASSKKVFRKNPIAGENQRVWTFLTFMKIHLKAHLYPR